MTDYLDIRLSEGVINGISTLGLAHIGDAVYELLVRTWLCTGGKSTARSLHRESVRRVSAAAQAEAAGRITDILSEDELAVFKRGRNTRVNSVPKHAGMGQYHMATGLEALFGWLYLRGEHGRIGELFGKITEEA